jgi:hypothetical protein
MVRLTDNEAQNIRDKIERALKNICKNGFTGKMYELLWGDQGNSFYHYTYFKCYWSKNPSHFFEIGFHRSEDGDLSLYLNGIFQLDENKARQFQYEVADFQPSISDTFNLYDQSSSRTTTAASQAHLWHAISKLADHVALLQERRP